MAFQQLGKSRGSLRSQSQTRAGKSSKTRGTVAKQSQRSHKR